MTPVQSLVDACVDDARMLAHCSQALDPVRRTVVERLASQRGRFVDDLRTVGRTLHVTPSANGSSTGTLRVLLRGAWVRVAGTNAGDALHACRQSQERIEARFEAALDGSWSHALHSLVTEQHRTICQARAVLDGLEHGSPG